MSKVEPLEDIVKLITRYSNWCYYDRLDDEDLVDGEKLCILFPDGTHGYYKVKLITGSDRVMEQGGYTDIPFKEAYITVDVYGAKLEVKLYKSGIRAIRVTDDNRKKD